MKLEIFSFILEAILLFAMSKVIQAAETENPCPRMLDHIVADMCTDDSVVEEGVHGSRTVDSIILRITKQQNNCICHVSLHSTVTNYTIYMSKYNGLSASGPVQQDCGLAIDVEYLDTSDKTRSLQSIQCTSGTSMRSIAFGGSNLIFKSRVTEGDFTRGYCMQVFRNESIFSCTMKDQVGMAGLDDDWIFKTQHTSLDACKRYCMQNEDCVGVQYEQNYFCFVYNTTSILVLKDDSIYSQKHCIDTQKLKVRCYPPESTTQTDQVTSTKDTFTTTVTKSTGHNHMTNSTTKSTIEREKENIIYKDTSPSFLAALVIAIIGCTVAVIFAGTTVYYKRQLLTQKGESPLESSVNYVDLSVARDVSDYSAINTQVGNEQYETVNDRN